MKRLKSSQIEKERDRVEDGDTRPGAEHASDEDSKDERINRRTETIQHEAHP